MSVRRPLTLLVLAVTAVVALVSPAAAAGAGTTQVSGLLTPAQAECQGDADALARYVVTGTLEGCWYVDTFDVEHTNAAGGFVSSGTEQFVGCLGDRCGRLFTTYTFTAKYSGDTEDHGRCHHPIVGGDGGFAGASGVINMHDLPNGCATYAGHVIV